MGGSRSGLDGEGFVCDVAQSSVAGGQGWSAERKGDQKGSYKFRFVDITHIFSGHHAL